jgi:hypothetical protein
LVPESRKAAPQHAEEASVELQDFMTKVPDLIPSSTPPPTIAVTPVDETSSSTDKKPDLSLVDISGGATNEDEEENIFLSE